MGKHRILCVHGIGEHSNDWVQDKDDGNQTFKELVAEKWKRYSALKGAFGSKVELHSIHYDDEIGKLFQSWKTEVDNLKKGIGTSPLLVGEIDWFTDLADRASDLKSKNDWKYTHLLDLLLFIGSPTIQDRFVNYVGNQILQIVKANKGDQFSLIGHSMGTAMGHKVLQALFNEGVVAADGSRSTLKGNFLFENVCMVANTSYGLSRDREGHYAGIARPSLSAGEGCCMSWINVNHELDPVGQFMRFNSRKNPKWLDPTVEMLNLYRDIAPHKISSASIHSINHYFRDPIFHIPYFEMTFGVEIDLAEKQAAAKDFEEGTPEGAFKSLKSHLKTIDVSNTESMREFFEAVTSFYNLTRQFA